MHAFDIARRAFMSATKAYDGRGKSTLLVKMLGDHLKVQTFENITSKIYHEMKTHDLASLAPIVTSAAQQGDDVAISILEDAGKELGITVVAVAKKLGMKKKHAIIGGVGGVFKSGEFVWAPFKRMV